MTESDWITCDEPTPLLDYLREHELLSDRKQRLIDCACVRRIGELSCDRRASRAVDVAEAYADALVDLDELRIAQAEALAAAHAPRMPSTPRGPKSYLLLNAAADAEWEFRDGADPLHYAAEAIAWDGLVGIGPPQRRIARARAVEERKAQASIVRDIAGNPFRHVSYKQPWRASNDLIVVCLAGLCTISGLKP